MTLPDRGLIVRKEHLDKILDGYKIWEMRGTPTKVRGPIALIEAGSGMIMGECVLIGSQQPLEEWERAPMHDFHQVDDLTLLAKWRYPWGIHSAKRYANPIPYDHPQGAVIWVKLGQVVTA